MSGLLTWLVPAGAAVAVVVVWVSYDNKEKFDMEAKRRFNRMAWWKQIVPRTLYTIYREGEHRYFCIWRQWLGRAYDIRRVPIAS